MLKSIAYLGAFGATGYLISDIQNYSLIYQNIFKFMPCCMHSINKAVIGNNLLRYDTSRFIDQNSKIDIGGIELNGEIGLASGYDTLAYSTSGLEKLGFSFFEIGPVTPNNQFLPKVFSVEQKTGNLRIAKEPHSWGVMSMKASLNTVKKLEEINGERKIRIGASIEPDTETVKYTPYLIKEDYVSISKKLKGLVDYISINFSQKDILEIISKDVPLREVVKEVKNTFEGSVFVRLPQDCDERLVREAVGSGVSAIVIENYCKVDENGYVIADKENQIGDVVARFKKYSGGKCKLIYSDGIHSGKDVDEAVKNGADAVQIMSEFITKGIDIKAGGRIRNNSKKVTKTSNVYIKLLIKLYKFLARRTDSKFNQTVLKRLNQSRITRYPLSVSRLVKNLKGQENKILVAVCNIVDDNRILDLPKMTVCALKFTENARKRIVAAGGQCLTFDQLAQKAPTGSNTILLRGARSREALRHFGAAPGTKGSHTKPYVRTKGKRDENARGK